jgi:hypothetical protein
MSQIELNYHQAMAVAERAIRVRTIAKRHREHGFTGNERLVLTTDSPYTVPGTDGLYLRIGGSQGAAVPLFAKDLGYERDFAVERLGARDVNGHLQHPDMDGIGFDEFDMGPQLRAIGWCSTTVSFESDSTQEQCDRYFDGNSPDCSYWTPTPPDHSWLLAAIYDTEDGPVAMFVRRAPEPDAGQT